MEEEEEEEEKVGEEEEKPSCETNDKYLLSSNYKALLGLWGVHDI